MNTPNVNRWSQDRYFRYAETALYGAMTLYLFSHLFLTNVPMNLQMATLVYLGALLGIATLCGVAPLTTRLTRRRTVARESAHDGTNVMTFTQKVHPVGQRNANKGSDDDGRRAA